jgi:hypothetical protein
MKNRDLYSYIQALIDVNDLKGVRFAYAVIKNKKKIEEEIILLEEVIKPNILFEEYEKKRVSLCEVHAEKDEHNKPVIIMDEYKLVDLDKFNEELDLLKNEYKEVVDERIRQINEYNKLLDEDIIIDFIKINFNELPDNITAKQLENINFMVEMD